MRLDSVSIVCRLLGSRKWKSTVTVGRETAIGLRGATRHGDGASGLGKVGSRGSRKGWSLVYSARN